MVLRVLVWATLNSLETHWGSALFPEKVLQSTWVWSGPPVSCQHGGPGHAPPPTAISHLLQRRWSRRLLANPLLSVPGVGSAGKFAVHFSGFSCCSIAVQFTSWHASVCASMFFPFIGEFTLMPRCFSRLSENSLWVSTLLTWRLDWLRSASFCPPTIEVPTMPWIQIFIDYNFTTQLNHFVGRWIAGAKSNVSNSTWHHDRMARLGHFSFACLQLIFMHFRAYLLLAHHLSSLSRCCQVCHADDRTTSRHFHSLSHKLLLGQRRLLWVILVGSEVQFIIGLWPLIHL